jgi:hypothetical protein
MRATESFVLDLVRRQSASSFQSVVTRPVIVFVAVALAVQHAVSADPSPTAAPDKSQYTLFNPTPIDLRRAYNTDRPSKTDSPFTIDAGAFQIESDVANWALDYEKDVRVRTWIIGNTNFKLGLTNWMDLQVFPQFYVNTRERPRLWKTGRTRWLRRHDCSCEN